MNEYVNMVGAVIDVAEHSTYLELTSRVCYYDEPNLNNDMLPYDEFTEERAQTLINMPVQAKYRISPNGEPTFSGHEMVKKKDGSIEFKTSSIGTHTEIYIENDNVDVNGTIKNLPCLFAKYRIWKRYKNVVAAVQRLFNLGKLYSSWELNTYQYIFNRGIRKVTDYEFLANTLLGFEYAYPSYGISANAISMAEFNDNQLVIAEALSQDLIDENNNNNKEENLLNDKMESSTVGENIVTSTSVENQSDNTGTTTASTDTEKNIENPTTDSAQLTDYDLRDKVRAACRTKLGKWCWVSFLFPNEKEVWCEYDGRESELDYVKFTYEVGDDDSITVSEPTYVKLTVSVAEINTKIAELEKEASTIKAELDIKNDAISKASETIQSLNVTISELKPFKEQVEIAEQKRIEIEIAEDKARLKAKLLKGNLFTETEIAEKNINDLIEARNESAINGLIADKFVASFDSRTSETTLTAETQEPEKATASLETDDDEDDIRSFMHKLLSK